jgi:hypothetical protein
MFERECYAYIPLCHGKKILVKPGDQSALGEFLKIADNAGFSTGLHTHMGLYRVESTNATTRILDQNDAVGSFDPSLFFTGQYAIDQASYSTLMRNSMRYFQYRAGLV